MDQPQVSRSGELVLSKKDQTTTEVIQSSPLMRIPPELRRMIYAEAFEDGIFCHCKNTTTKPPRAPNGSALLLACRQLYQEALPYAFDQVTLCNNPKHTQHLRALYDLNIRAFFSIRHLNVSITCHRKVLNCEDCPRSYAFWLVDCLQPRDWAYQFGSQEWDKTLTDLSSKRLNLEVLRVRFVCLHKCHNALHMHTPFPRVLRTLKPSCREIAICGAFKIHTLNFSGIPDHTLKEDGDNLYLRASVHNRNYRQKWDEIRAAQKEILWEK